MFPPDQRDDDAVGAGAAGATRAVHVVGGIGRRVVVDHQRHGVDVDPPRRDVRRHQHVDPAALKGGQRPFALVLAAVAVDGGRPEAGAAEPVRKPVRAALGPAEHDGRPPGCHHLCGERHPVGVLDPPEVVLHLALVGRGRLHLVKGRLVLVVADQLVDGSVQRGREEQRLAVGARHVDETAHGGQEAHVGHAVGLVDHHDVDVIQFPRPLLHQVLEPPGAGDQNVGAVAQRGALRAVADAAVDRGHAGTDGRSQGTDDVLNLGGQLTGRDQDERRGLAAPATRQVLGRQPGQDRQAEGQRLPRTGGSHAADVTSGETVGQGGGLDGERTVDPSLFEGRRKLARHAQVREPGRRESRGKGGHKTPIGQGKRWPTR